MKALISFLVAIICAIFGVFSIGKCPVDPAPIVNDDVKYSVNYDGAFTLAKDEYCEGELVEALYDVIATDTDYYFFVDGEAVDYSYREDKGFLISFIMPDHDVELSVKTKNTMANIIEIVPQIPEGEVILEESGDYIIAADMFDEIANEEVQGLYSNNELLFLEYMKKTPENAGIPKACVRMPYSFGDYYEITVDGLLFGKRAFGYLAPDILDEGEEITIKTMTLYSYELNYQDCFEKLCEIYGEASANGIEPYAVSNGGAVEWAVFRNDSGSFKISTGSNNDWIAVTYETAD